MALEIKKDEKDIMKEQLGTSNDLIQKGAFQQARALLIKTIQAEPEHNSSYMLFGYCARTEEKWEEAHKWYLKGLESEPDSLTLLVLLAEALLMCRRFSEAENILHKVIEIDIDGMHAEFARTLLEASNLGVYGAK